MVCGGGRWCVVGVDGVWCGQMVCGGGRWCVVGVDGVWWG